MFKGQLAEQIGYVTKFFGKEKTPLAFHHVGDLLTFGGRLKAAAMIRPSDVNEMAVEKTSTAEIHRM